MRSAAVFARVGWSPFALARRCVVLGVTLICALANAPAAVAQVLRVHVVESISGGVVVGALVSAIGPSGSPSHERITDSLGTIVFRLATAGSWRVRVRRIGYPPHDSGPIELSAGGSGSLQIVLTSARSTLPKVSVTAIRGKCESTSDSTQRVSALWEQVVIALRLASVTRSEQRTPLRITLMERDVGANLSPISERVTGMAFGSNRPFGAIDPDSLAATGYVRRAPDGGYVFFAPDDSVLLSHSFRRTHCFGAPPSAPGSTSAILEFWPADSSRLAGIAGTAELDLESGEPRNIAFRYVVPARLLPVAAPLAGGRLTLRRLPTGEWIIPSWLIRMPLFAASASDGRIAVVAYREQMGVAEPQRIARARSPSAAADAEPHWIRLRVVDDSGRGVARAVVYAGDTSTGLVSKADGSVALRTSLGASIRVRIRRIGFAPLDTTVSSTLSDVLPVRLRRAVVLDRVTIVDDIPLDRVGFTARQKLGLGEYLTPNEIARRPAPSALDLLQGMSGVRIYRVPVDIPPPRDMDLAREWSPGAEIPVLSTQTSLTGRGGICLPHIFIDGRQASVAQLSSLSTGDLLALEVYNQGTRLPQEFQRPRDEVCGALVVWTRIENR
jgi:hypothetical protein